MLHPNGFISSLLTKCVCVQIVSQSATTSDRCLTDFLINGDDRSRSGGRVDWQSSGKRNKQTAKGQSTVQCIHCKEKEENGDNFFAFSLLFSTSRDTVQIFSRFACLMRTHKAQRDWITAVSTVNSAQVHFACVNCTHYPWELDWKLENWLQTDVPFRWKNYSVEKINDTIAQRRYTFLITFPYSLKHILNLSF